MFVQSAKGGAFESETISFIERFSLEAERQIERVRRPYLGPMGTVRQVEEEIEAPTDGQCSTICEEPLPAEDLICTSDD